MEGILMGVAWLNFFILVFGLLMLVAGIFAFIFWIRMLVDAITRKMSDGEKIAWVIVIVFLHAIGALIYYFAVKRKK